MIKGHVPSSFEAALNAPSSHRLLKGRGYVKVSPLPMPQVGTPGRCNPPANAADMSVHQMQPPQGGSPLEFVWSAKTNTWLNFTMDAKRIGFPPDYLSRHGWVYVGPVIRAVH